MLCKTLALPTHISNGTFVQYLPEFFAQLYFVYRSRIYCMQNNITICPADKVIYSTQLMTCELSLFFQTMDSLNLCHRKLLLHHTTPLLQHYDSTLIYPFPESQHIILR